MTRAEFEREYCLQESEHFAPERLFASEQNRTTDSTRLSAVKFEFFRFVHAPCWPAAIIVHTTPERAGEVVSYAHRHRCEVREFKSWHRADLISIALLRRPG